MEHQNKREIISDSSRFFAGTSLSGIVSIIRGVIIARALGPNNYGIWVIFMTIFSYNDHTNVGFIHGLCKEMPFLKGKGDIVQAEKVKQVSAWVIGVISIAIFIGLLVSSFLLKNIFSREIIFCIRVTAFITVLQQLYTLLTSLLRIDKLFGLLSSAIAFLPFFSLCCMLFLFLFIQNKLYAVILGLLFGYLLTNTFIFIKSRYVFRPFFDFAVVKRLFIVGLPIIMINIGFIFFFSVDKWIIIKMLDKVQLGYYGIGIFIANFLFSLSSVSAYVLYPRMLERYGKSNNPKSSENLVYIPTVVIAYLMVIVCAAAALVAPFIIHWVVPSFILGSNAAVIVIMGIYFLSIMTISGNFLQSIDKQNVLIYFQIAAIIISLGLNYFFITHGYGIGGVALGTSVAYLFYGTSVIFACFRNFFNSPKVLLLKVIQLYIPFFLSVPLVYCLLRYFKTDNGSFANQSLMVCIRVVILLFCSVPLVFYLDKITGIFTILRKLRRRDRAMVSAL